MITVAMTRKQEWQFKREGWQWVEQLKLDTGCQWPGCQNVIETPEQLEFAHLDQEDKEFNISDFLKYSPHVQGNRQRLEDEIAKCKVLCLLHHRLETVQQKHAAWRRGISLGEAALHPAYSTARRWKTESPARSGNSL